MAEADDNPMHLIARLEGEAPPTDTTPSKRAAARQNRRRVAAVFRAGRDTHAIDEGQQTGRRRDVQYPDRTLSMSDIIITSPVIFTQKLSTFIKFHEI